MKTIHKFEFAVADAVKVLMPRNAKVIRVGLQRLGHVCLWAMVDTEGTKVERVFSVRGTGHPIDGCGEYLGTAFDGDFIWHVFGDN